MKGKQLKDAFSSHVFKNNASATTQQLADYLNLALSGNEKVTSWRSPEEEYNFWKSYSYESLTTFHEDLLSHSIHLHHPAYLGHQVTPTLPLAAIETMVGALLNNGMAVYEMGQAASAMERCVVEILAPYYGYSNHSDGLFTSGGTVANLTALLCARANLQDTNVWSQGNREKLAIMVCEEAHYCIDRAVRIMGWGDEGAILLKGNSQFTMMTEDLEKNLKEAQAKGIRVIGVVASAPSTSTGKYDDLKKIGEFCQLHQLWYHIDAAHGGPAAYSPKYQHLMEGCEMADSITVDGHKMMMMPGLTTLLLFKNKETSYRTFAQKAQYLFSQGDEEWYNYGKRTMECTKLMMSLRMYAALQEYGMALFAEYVETCYDLAMDFYNQLLEDERFECAVKPDSNIVCFRINSLLLDKNELNKSIRKKLLENGQTYIVQTQLRGEIYLRTTIMNPFTTSKEFEFVIREIIAMKEELEANGHHSSSSL